MNSFYPLAGNLKLAILALDPKANVKVEKNREDRFAPLYVSLVRKIQATQQKTGLNPFKNKCHKKARRAMRVWVEICLMRRARYLDALSEKEQNAFMISCRKHVVSTLSTPVFTPSSYVVSRIHTLVVLEDAFYVVNWSRYKFKTNALSVYSCSKFSFERDPLNDYAACSVATEDVSKETPLLLPKTAVQFPIPGQVSKAWGGRPKSLIARIHRDSGCILKAECRGMPQKLAFQALNAVSTQLKYLRNQGVVSLRVSNWNIRYYVKDTWSKATFDLFTCPYFYDRSCNKKVGLERNYCQEEKKES